MARIPIIDLQDEIRQNRAAFQAAFDRLMDTGQFILGPEVEDFEKEFAAYLGVPHAIACNSGTDALIIGLRALGVVPGDEVITSPFTFFATAEAISLVGATPVFVDIEPASFNIDVSQIEAKITPRTRAIVPVHLFGHSADMQPLLAVAQKHGLKVLEDVAQATGATYHGTKVGSLGGLGAFSFFPTKNLGAFGDGGMMVTADAEVARECRMLRVHGSERRYHNEKIGYNSRLDALQAAFLRVKLANLDHANELRRQVARRYNEVLGGIEGVLTPTEASYTQHVYHQYTLRVQNGRRDELQKKLADAGIVSMLYYPIPLHRLPMYAGGSVLPEAEKAAAEVISLPIWPTISAQAQLEVAQAIRSALL